MVFVKYQFRKYILHTSEKRNNAKMCIYNTNILKYKSVVHIKILILCKKKYINEYQ